MGAEAEMAEAEIVCQKPQRFSFHRLEAANRRLQTEEQMSSPTFSDALSYVVDAQAEILSAVADWKSYADAAAEAYSQAYEDQGRVLGSQ